MWCPTIFRISFDQNFDHIGQGSESYIFTTDDDLKEITNSEKGNPQVEVPRVNQLCTYFNLNSIIIFVGGISFNLE